jgi:hypothetical protein
MPEEFELEKKREELAVLESQLVERELELETLRGGLLAFEKKYQAATLERYAELDELRARIAEIQVSHAPQNKAAQLEAAAQRAKAEKTAAAARKYKPRPRPKDPTTKKVAPPPPPPDFNPSETLKRLYRDVAKTLHPDLANDDTERANRHDFMARANEAYEQNSESRLAEILHEWNSSPESVRGDTPAAELIRAIRKIARCQQRLVTITIEIEKLTTGGIFGIKLLAEEAEKLEADFLADMTARLDSEIAGAKMLLQKLDPAALPPPPPGAT